MDFLPERRAVVVTAFAPLLDDSPDRARLRAASGPGGPMRFKNALQEAQVRAEEQR